MKTLMQMKRMISMAMAAVAALCLSWNAGAFHGNPDKIKAEKIAFITAELELTPAEAEKFWPVYNKMAGEQKDALTASIKAFKNLSNALKTDADASIKTLTKLYLDANKTFQELEGKYLEDFLKVLPAKKVAKLFLSEEKFRREQIHRLGKNKNKDKDRPMFEERGPREQKDRD